MAAMLCLACFAGAAGDLRPSCTYCEMSSCLLYLELRADWRQRSGGLVSLRGGHGNISVNGIAQEKSRMRAAQIEHEVMALIERDAEFAKMMAQLERTAHSPPLNQDGNEYDDGYADQMVQVKNQMRKNQALAVDLSQRLPPEAEMAADQLLHLTRLRVSE